MGQRHSRNSQTYVMITGLHEAGKTELMRHLDADIKDQIVLNIGPAETVKYGNVTLASLSLEWGGRNPLRPLYRHFCQKFAAMIFVIDSESAKQFEGQLGVDFELMVEATEKQKLPILVLANKQDLPEALTCEQLADILEMKEYNTKRTMEIFPTSAETGEGITEAMEWMYGQLEQQHVIKTVVDPVKQAIPPSLTTSSSCFASSLKKTFGLAKTKFAKLF